MRIYLETLGCRLNYAEMAALGRQLVESGHDLTDSAVDADLCVLNSCTVTGEAARKSRQLIRQMARANPTARLMVTGCYATLEGEAVAQLPNVALVVGNTRKDDLLALIRDFRDQGAGVRGQATGDRGQGSVGTGYGPSSTQPATRNAQLTDLVVGEPWPVAPPVPVEGFIAGPVEPQDKFAIRNSQSEIGVRTRAFVKVQDGCHNRCTFCIVTVARGDERSRPVAEVVAEVNALHREGYQEAVLTGVHLGAYGHDDGSDLRSLLAALLAETTVPRLRLSSLEPFDLAPVFFDLWAGSAGRLMPHLHLPAQSGSDAVLRRMARRNRVADFEALTAAARAAIPGLTITTDLIAGFPGETEADFAETIAFARRVGFAHLHVFPYSARAGAAAARFGGQVPNAERHRRSRVLIELDAELGRAVRAAFLGQTRPVLWESSVIPSGSESQSSLHGQDSEESPSQNRDSSLMTHRDALCVANPLRVTPSEDSQIGPLDQTTIWSGLTDNYLRVHAAVPAGVDLHNRITSVQLVRLEQDELWGELLTR
ncbi:MAG: tRNA (N(6)-L-threonylcarbamoyladenosine(37)-C(2))-methylthiotransferase MtaB [Chloroflexi bacterium HGW-Chloroflexi-1]|nr:MAG: tRNA (N(6)-L-threonylcarbamoyladenosine(37)-C(2))-methylthiotransferase MtaB [Chloroflexi bacterium HGW-Chloroflexi-1]